MISSNELRIGSVTKQGRVIEIKTQAVRVTYQAKIDMRRTSVVLFEDLNPIPLTEEILLKCGFEKVRFEKYAHKKLNKLRAYPHITNDFGVYIMGAYTLPHIKYLHQLQSLYFAITGEELNIQL